MFEMHDTNQLWEQNDKHQIWTFIQLYTLIIANIIVPDDRYHSPYIDLTVMAIAVATAPTTIIAPLITQITSCSEA